MQILSINIILLVNECCGTLGSAVIEAYLHCFEWGPNIAVLHR